MRFSTVATHLAASLGYASYANAFHIPEGQPSGVYAVQMHENGTESHVRVGDPADNAELPANYTSFTPVSPSERRSLAKRWLAKCYYDEILPSGADMDHNSFLRATWALGRQIYPQGTYLFPGYHLYSLDECVVTYYCDLSTKIGIGKPQLGSVATKYDYKKAWDKIDLTCGQYHPGSVVELRGRRDGVHAEVTYGREVFCTARGHNFCGSGVRGDKDGPPGR